MSLLTSIRLGSLAAAASLAVVAPTSSAQAGLLDFLFGGGYQAPAPSYAPSYRSSPSYRPSSTYYDSGPIDIRVNPRRRGSSKGMAVPAVGAPERKPILARAIDPVKHPNWHLQDTTLRRGDIVVLKGQVLVYDGVARGPVTPAAFTSLGKSPLVSRGEKARIEQMADTSGPVPDAPVAAPNKAAELTQR